MRVAENNREALFLHERAAALSRLEVYLGEFIGILQGRPTEIQQIMRKLFRAIDKLFRPNTEDKCA